MINREIPQVIKILPLGRPGPIILQSQYHFTMGTWHCFHGYPIDNFMATIYSRYYLLIFQVLWPKYSYSHRTRPMPWLMMPWLLASPEHHQPWYWLCKTNRSLAFVMRQFIYVPKLFLNRLKNENKLIFSQIHRALKWLSRVLRIACQTTEWNIIDSCVASSF